MKQIIYFLLLLTIPAYTIAQTTQVYNAQASHIENGINVDVYTVSFNGAGFIESNFLVENNNITISLCYWFDVTLPQPFFHHTIFIPLDFSYNEYVINIVVINSQSQQICDYFNVSDNVYFNYLSTENFTLQNKDEYVYPNPTNGVLHLSNKISKSSSIEIFDSLGRLQKSFKNMSDTEININDLSSGVYLLKIIDTEYVKNFKIILK